MAMLAEPRRKKRSINLRGKNHWSEDQNKFGKKLMEKMGWTEGKGLGINENGNVDHLKVRFKDDNGGVGFKDLDNQWTEHETNFESLLKNLHGGNVDTKKLHSEISLEEKSKNLQSRLHYKKFTRGKDVTKYSHKDLANIFGKKSLNQPNIETKTKDEDVEEIKEELTVSSLKLVEGGCMKEYFKIKMSAIKTTPSDDKPSVIYDEEDSVVAFQGFSLKNNQCEDEADSQENSSKNFKSINFCVASEGIDNDSAVKKSKKKKKTAENCDNEIDSADLKKKSNYFAINFCKSTSDAVTNDEDTTKKRKFEECSEVVHDLTIDQPKSFKTKKSKKIKLEDNMESDVEIVDVIKKKKSKKSKKNNDSGIKNVEDVVCDNSIEEFQEASVKKKKKNKNPLTTIDLSDELDSKNNRESSSETSDYPKKKKKNKQKIETLVLSEEVENQSEKKKKKKKIVNDPVNEQSESSDSMPSNNDSTLNQKVKATRSRRKKQTYKPLVLDDVRRLRSSSYSQVVQECLPTTDTNIINSIANTRKLVKKPVNLSDVNEVQNKCKLLKEHLKNTSLTINEVEMEDVSEVNPASVPSTSREALSNISLSSFPTILSSQTASNSWELLSLKKMLDDPFVSSTRKQYLNQRILELNDAIIKELLLSTQRTSKSEEICLLENLCSMFDSQNLSDEQKRQLECVLSALRGKVINEIMKDVGSLSSSYEKTIADLQSLLNLKCLSDVERDDIMKKVIDLREKAAKGLIKQTHVPMDDGLQLLDKVKAIMNDPFLPEACKDKLLHKMRYFKNKTINKLTHQDLSEAENDATLTTKLRNLLQDPNLSFTKRLQIIDKIRNLESSASNILQSYKHELKSKLTSAMSEVLRFVGTNLDMISGYGINFETERFVEFLQPDTS